MKNLTLKNITSACGGTYYGDKRFLETEVTEVSTDSRKISLGSLFIALVGTRVDGHDFITSCYEKGALCCVSEKQINVLNKPLIVVENCFQALKDIAAFYRNQLNIPFIGITGSVGKTGTKNMIASVLSQKYNCLWTIGSLNNDIGLPQTILRLREEHEVAVLEMGINHFGEMTVLSEIARPDIVVIANVGPCHLENLIDLEGVLRAKSEVFKNMNSKGPVFLNGDTPPLSLVSSVNGNKPVFFGLKRDLDYYADNYEELGYDGITCTLHSHEWSLPVHISLPGKHMMYHALTASAIGRHFGLSDTEIKNGIESLKSESGRNNCIKANNITVVDDCYNASPIAMKGSIETLSKCHTRKVCILGDMFELGDNAKALHYEVGSLSAKCNIDLVLTVGELSENIHYGALQNKATSALHFETKEALQERLPELITPGDTILVKASHGMHFEILVKYLCSKEFNTEHH